MGKFIGLHLLTSSDQYLRPTMAHVKMDRETTVATDSHVLGWFKTADHFDKEFVEDIPEEGLLIHSDDWKKLAKGVGVVWKTPGEVIKILHSGKKRDELIECTTEEKVGRYPQWKAVVNFDREAKPVPKIALNGKLLAKLQTAYNAESVRLKMNEPNRAIHIQFNYEDEKMKDFTELGALLMPVLMEDEEERKITAS